MTISDTLEIPGVHHAQIAGLVGTIETIVDVPLEAKQDYLAIIGHPHSLQGGTMNNKVVTTLAKVFHQLAIPSIRFNFRGVGQSQGVYDAGIGESADMLHLLRACHSAARMVFFAGFSFGSYVAFRALGQYQHEYQHATCLITIAPPVHHYDYTTPLAPQTPWLIIQGLIDDVVPPDVVTDFGKQSVLSPEIVYFADTGHFFHGKLGDLQSCLIAHIAQWQAL